MARVRIRGNPPLLFLLFFGLATLLAGLTYEAYQAYASSGSLGLALLAASSAVGFVFASTIVARVLYKVTV